ncbi:MAG: protein kinase [Thermoleophilia bacterium]|nr:protein kinase [Thermoleophilia bacterium]
MADLPDRLVEALKDRYTLVRELGRGGMATVYLATDLRHERAVALKVLKPELAAVLGPDRFLHEIKTTAQLTHPHILPLHDSGDADGFLYYVMPYVAGESLRDRLTREKQLPLDDALQIAREVADALSCAHAHGVIHRDIKPENILLESGHAVVADFGIAKAIAAAGSEKLTETGLALGTPAYMSPEQAAGSKDLDGRSDLYALGCVLYEMLAGQPPFTGPTAESLIHQHLALEPHKITALRPAVPAHVAATLERALAKTPADRFNPVSLFAEALGPRASAAVPAPPERAGRRSRRWSWERRALIGVLALAGLAAVTLTARRVLSPHPTDTEAMPRIVVLPFENLGAADDAYFAAGVTDAITARLAAMQGIRVLSRSSAVQIAGGSGTLKEAGQRLGATHVLEGTVQRERPGDPTSRVRVIPQLIDLGNDSHLWAGTFDRSGEGLFAIQSAIADSVAAALALAFGGARGQRPKEPTTSREAYDSYLRGLYFARKGGAAGYDSAARYLERAIEQDSTFAAAFAAISVVYGAIGGGVEGTEEWFVKARASARRAIGLDSSLAEAWWALSTVTYSRFAGFRHEETVRSALKAISLNPSFSEAHETLAFVLTHVGMLDRAEREVQITRSLDPLNIGAQFRLAQIALARGEYDIAATELARVPNLWAKPYMAEALVGQGRPLEALDLLASLDTTHAEARPLVIASIAAVALAHVGDTVRALERIRRSMEDLAFFDHAHHVEYNIGAAYAILGEHETALGWFRRAVDGGFPCLPAYERPAFLGSLRSDARYAEFLDSLREESMRLRRSIEALVVQ